MKKIKVSLIIMMAFVAFLACSKSGVKTNAFDVEFHRGGRDARPENTLYAFQYAIENGANSIECDMQITSDGVPVLSHSIKLNPEITTDENGNRIKEDLYISRMTLDELKKYNVGQMNKNTEYYQMHGRSQIMVDTSIPTLRELFELVRDSGDTEIIMNIEIKVFPDSVNDPDYVNQTDADFMLEKFYQLVKEFGFEDRVLLQSFDWSILIKMKKIDYSIKTVALYSEQESWGTPDATTLWLNKEEASPWLAGINIHDFNDDPVKAANAIGIDIVSPYYEEVTMEQVNEAHSFGIKVIPWTVNNISDVERMYEFGVDGIITDKPWLIREYLISKKVKVRPKRKLNLPYHLDVDHIEVEIDKVEGGMDAAY